jgi:ribosomal protein L11 methyltransferase
MYWKVQIERLASQAYAEHLIQYVEDVAFTAAWFKSDKYTDHWCLEALFAERPDQNWLKDLAQDNPYTLEYLPERNWVAENQADFPPLTVGSFYIYGSHIDDPLPEGKICLQIDAATAFGTGEHATTQGCLLLMEALNNDSRHFQNMLDLGCGTGILGMAAACLFNQQTVTLSDNDKEALAVATVNLEKNRLKNRASVILSEGFEHPCLKARSPFDLIMANILAAPLITLAPEINAHTTDQAFVILSGLLASQATDVVEAYAAHGFRLEQQRVLKEWAALLLHKQSTKRT